LKRLTKELIAVGFQEKKKHPPLPRLSPPKRGNNCTYFYPELIFRSLHN